MHLEVTARFRSYRNVAVDWTFCLIHDGHHLSEESMKSEDCLNRTYQFVKLLKNSDYPDNWMSSMVRKLAKDGDILPHSSPEAIRAARAQSDAIIERIARLSVYRGHLAKGRSHPSLGAKSKAAQIPAELVEHIEILKKYWHMTTRNFPL